MAMCIIKCCIALAIAAIIIFPSFRQKLKSLVSGFLNVFVEDVAKTPEGAKAFYSQAIEEEQIKYNQAKDTLNNAAGQKIVIEKDVEKLQNMLKTIESKCENAVKSGRMEDARLFAEQREECVVQLDVKKEMLAELTPMVEQAQKMCAAREKQLNKLKSDSVRKVEEIRTKQQLITLANDLDEMRADSGTDKLLASIDSGLRDLTKKSTGAIAVHENKTSTKFAAADERARQDSTSDYLAGLEKKYGGKK